LMEKVEDACGTGGHEAEVDAHAQEVGEAPVQAVHARYPAHRESLEYQACAGFLDTLERSWPGAMQRHGRLTVAFRRGPPDRFWATSDFSPR
jgi:hypothetical protein